MSLVKMDTLVEYVRVSHVLPHNSLWLLQGDGHNDWFVAHEWQKDRLYEFYTSDNEHIAFTKHGYEYCIQSVLIHEGLGIRETVFKNCTTGMVRLVQRCNIGGCPFYSHKGCERDGITMLKNNPDTNEISGHTILV
jgi:hypothetical protein